MLSELAECTVLMLRVIHEMYSTQRITYEEFVNHTRKKLQFLSENISQFTSESEQETAYDILNKCSSIPSGNEGSYLP